jgi:hypothetical protein
MDDEAEVAQRLEAEDTEVGHALVLAHLAHRECFALPNRLVLSTLTSAATVASFEPRSTTTFSTPRSAAGSIPWRRAVSAGSAVLTTALARTVYGPKSRSTRWALAPAVAAASAHPIRSEVR